MLFFNLIIELQNFLNKISKFSLYCFTIWTIILELKNSNFDSHYITLSHIKYSFLSSYVVIHRNHHQAIQK